MGNQITEGTKSVYAQIAETYVLENEDRSFIEPQIKQFVALLPENGILLDLGCGTGFDTRDFGRLRPDLRLFGIDISPQMLDIARKLNPGIDFQEGDILDFDIPSEAFDGVWFNAALLHIPKAEAKDVMDKIAKSLKPGGYLYVRVKEGEGEKLVPAANYGREDLERFFAFYTLEELRKLLENSSLAVTQEGSHMNNKTKWITITGRKSGGD